MPNPVEGLTPDTNFDFLNRLLKDTRTTDVTAMRNMLGSEDRTDYSPNKEIKVRIETGGAEVAKIGKIGDGPRAVKRISQLEDAIIDPAQIYEYTAVSADDMFTNQQAEKIVIRGNIQGADAFKANEDYIRAKNAIELENRRVRAEEKMLCDLITTGKIESTITNPDTGVVESKYEYSSGAVAEELTADSSTDFYKIFIDAIDSMMDEGYAPNYLFATQNVANFLKVNAKLKTYMDKTINMEKLALTDLRNKNIRVSLTWNNSEIPDIWTYYGGYQGGRYIPQADATHGKLIMLCDRTIMKGYGAIRKFKPDIYVRGEKVTWERPDENGDDLYQYILSRPLWWLRNKFGIKIWNVTLS